MNVWRDESHRPRNGPILKAEEIIGSTMSAESATCFSLESFPKLKSNNTPKLPLEIDPFDMTWPAFQRLPMMFDPVMSV